MNDILLAPADGAAESSKDNIRKKREFLSRLIRERSLPGNRMDRFFCSKDFLRYIEKAALADASIKNCLWETADEASDDVLYNRIYTKDAVCAHTMLKILEDVDA